MTDYPAFLDLSPARRASGQLRLPGSKSISNRMLLLAALAGGTTRLEGLLDSDDTRVMLQALERLGVKVSQAAGSYDVQGAGGAFPVKQAELFLGNAGTAFRPLTAALALMGGTYQLSGTPRMHERPIGDLVDGLRQIGCDVRYLAQEGYPPLGVHRASISLQGPVKVRGDVSSQFLSALLMALPLLGCEVVVEVTGDLISKPYVALTLNLLQRFGIVVQREGWQRFVIPASRYQSPASLVVEGDASSASYFLAAGVLGGGPVRVLGVGEHSIQGDVKFADVLARMGARVGAGPDWLEASGALPLQPIDADCNEIPDAAMTLAVCALAAPGTSRLRNIASWRVKETDRLTAMATELRKLGAEVEEGADFISITPPAALSPRAVIDTYDDHRMAMCFSLVSLLGVPVRINDPGCVAKTYPDYWTDFARICQG